jgi:ABC-type histidine transport system ATPase subunit
LASRPQAEERADALLTRVGLYEKRKQVAEVLNIVRQLADEGMTMLLATHEMSFAREASRSRPAASE